jgi:hypothetical protein
LSVDLFRSPPSIDHDKSLIVTPAYHFTVISSASHRRSHLSEESSVWQSPKVKSEIGLRQSVNIIIYTHIYDARTRQEALFIEGRLEIRTEGEILGYLWFEELYKHPLAKNSDPKSRCCTHHASQ